MSFKQLFAIQLSVLLLAGTTACSTSPDSAGNKPTSSSVVDSSSPHVARAFGSVLRRDAETRVLDITHSPVPEADWPIMQMEFYVSREIDLSEYFPGDAVEFLFNFAAEQTPVIVAMRRTSPQELIAAMWPETAKTEQAEPD